MATHDPKTPDRGGPPIGMVGAPELEWNRRPLCESSALAPAGLTECRLDDGREVLGNPAMNPGPRRRYRAYDPGDMSHVEQMAEAGCRSGGGRGKVVARCRRRAPECAVLDPTNIIGDDAGEPPNESRFCCGVRRPRQVS